MTGDGGVSNKSWVLITVAAIGAVGAIVAAAINAGSPDSNGLPPPTSETTTRGGVEESTGGRPSTPMPATSTTPSSSTISRAPPALMYPETTLSFELDGCGREDDIDLDVPEHPYLASAAEIDFEYCLQSYIYVVGKNGAVISEAAPPDADQQQCVQAVKEEPAGPRTRIEAGLVACVVHYDESGSMRVFRLVVQQVSGYRPTSIVLTAIGWR
jgi:hypothetical protein